MSPSPSLARRAIGPTRPQRPQVRAGRGAQAKHNDPPSARRAVTTRVLWHAEHASESCRVRQRGHNPTVPSRINPSPVRSQRAQAGTANTEPRARSSPTRRPTTGGAPAARIAGPSASAVARLRAAAGLVMVASMAAATSPAASSGHATVTTVVIVSTRQTPQGPGPPVGR
jgi:hypothetical protein